MALGTRPREFLQVLTLVCVVLFLVGAGFYFGVRFTRGNLRSMIDAFDFSRTLGGVGSDRRSELSAAFDDPSRAEAELDDYIWAVANMPSPFVGVAPVPGEYASASINHNQLRHPTPLQIPKPPGTFRIFVTGGSTAFGAGAPSDAATIPSYLQEILDRELVSDQGVRYEVINAANPAWASTHERILIENRLSEWEPDLVISLSGNNDVHFGFLGMHVLWFRTYAEQHFLSLLSGLLEAAGGQGFAIPWEPSTPGPVAPSEVMRRLEKNLRLASVALEGTGAPYVFVLQPTLASTQKRLSSREAAQLAREELGEGSNAYFAECYDLFRRRLPQLDFPGFHFVDASSALDDRSSDEEIFLDSYHFGDRGNRILAERLFDLLEPYSK